MIAPHWNIAVLINCLYIQQSWAHQQAVNRPIFVCWRCDLTVHSHVVCHKDASHPSVSHTWVQCLCVKWRNWMLSWRKRRDSSWSKLSVPVTAAAPLAHETAETTGLTPRYRCSSRPSTCSQQELARGCTPSDVWNMMVFILLWSSKLLKVLIWFS